MDPITLFHCVSCKMPFSNFFFFATVSWHSEKALCALTVKGDVALPAMHYSTSLFSPLFFLLVSLSLFSSSFFCRSVSYGVSLFSLLFYQHCRQEWCSVGPIFVSGDVLYILLWFNRLKLELITGPNAGSNSACAGRSREPRRSFVSMLLCLLWVWTGALSGH